MQYLKIMKYVILIYGDTKAKIMFFMLLFTNSRYFKKRRVCLGLLTHPPLIVYGIISKLITCSS